MPGGGRSALSRANLGRGSSDVARQAGDLALVAAAQLDDVAVGIADANTDVIDPLDIDGLAHPTPPRWKPESRRGVGRRQGRRHNLPRLARPPSDAKAHEVAFRVAQPRCGAWREDTGEHLRRV